MARAATAANIDKLSQKMALHQSGANMSALDPAEAKALEAYNAAGAKYLQMRNAALAKIAPKQQNSRNTLKKCLKAHA
jgi:hypothetical protein